MTHDHDFSNAKVIVFHPEGEVLELPDKIDSLQIVTEDKINEFAENYSQNWSADETHKSIAYTTGLIWSLTTPQGGKE